MKLSTYAKLVKKDYVGNNSTYLCKSNSYIRASLIIKHPKLRNLYADYHLKVRSYIKVTINYFGTVGIYLRYIHPTWSSKQIIEEIPKFRLQLLNNMIRDFKEEEKK